LITQASSENKDVPVIATALVVLNDITRSNTKYHSSSISPSS